MSEEKVYACCHKYEEASVQEGIVVKRTAKQVKLRYEGRSSAFGYRNVIPVGDFCLAPTKAEAIRRAMVRAHSNLEYQTEKLNAAKEYINRLYQELVKEEQHEANTAQQKHSAKANTDEAETTQGRQTKGTV